MSQHSHDTHHDSPHINPGRVPYNDDDSRADTLAALAIIVIAVLACVYFVAGL